MKLKRLNNPTAINALLLVFSLAVFVVDTITPLGAVEWITYILPIILAGRISRPWAVVALAILCSGLIILGFVYSPLGSIEPSLALTNRLSEISVLWVIAVLLVLHRRSQDELATAQGQVKTKTGETAGLAKEKAELKMDKAKLVSEIEARKLIERQRSDFFSMVTHDLKSPMSVIMGYADMLLEDKRHALDDESLEIVTAMKKSSEKLLDIVNVFLDVSRLETGATALDKSPEDAAALIRETAEFFKPVAAKKGIALDMKAGEGIPRVMFDKKYVERAVTNLVTNALNYTPEGGRVTLGTHIIEGSLELSVSDTGPGIPPGEKEKVFEKFYRAGGASGTKGSGLGLAIVKGVAEAHGGRVELESTVGSGSTFRMIIPVSE